MTRLHDNQITRLTLGPAHRLVEVQMPAGLREGSVLDWEADGSFYFTQQGVDGEGSAFPEQYFLIRASGGGAGSMACPQGRVFLGASVEGRQVALWVKA